MRRSSATRAAWSPRASRCSVRARVACARNDSSHQACSSNHRHPASSASGRPRHNPIASRRTRAPSAASEAVVPSRIRRCATPTSVPSPGRSRTYPGGTRRMTEASPRNRRSCETWLCNVWPAPGGGRESQMSSVRRSALTTSPARSARAAAKAVRRSPLIARACPSTVTSTGPSNLTCMRSPGSSLMLSDTISVALPAGPVAARLQSRCSTRADPEYHEQAATNRQEPTPKGKTTSREERRAEEA